MSGTKVKGIIFRLFKIAIALCILVCTIICTIHYQNNAYSYKVSISIGLDIANIVVLSFLYILLAIEDNNERWRTYFHIFTLTVLIAAFMDLMTYFVEGMPNEVITNYIFTTFDFIGSPLILCFFFLYQNKLYNVTSKKYIYNVIILVILAALDTIMIVLNLKYKYLFSINDSGYYVQGDYYYLSIIFPLIVIITAVAYNFTLNIPLGKRITLLSFLMIPLLTSIFSILFDDLAITSLGCTIGVLILYGLVHIDRNNEINKKNMEIINNNQRIMLSQIQPHFIYNSLGAISALCETNPEMAIEAIDKFSEYLRTNMKVIEKTDLVSFDEELKHVETYVWLEKIRFGNKLNINYDIKYKEFCLPPLTVQPLVENAIKHGICKRKYGGTVTLRTYLEDNYIIIEIEDDGVGFDSNVDDGEFHVGLRNVSNRLQSLVSGILQVKSEVDKGTKCKIIIPLDGVVK